MAADIPQTLPLDAALHQAIAHHQAGQLQDAERLYRAILQAQPNHPDANHNLGVLAVQVKQPAAGLPHFKKALEANPSQGQFWLSYIDALIQADQTDAARQVLEQGRQRWLTGEAVEALARRLDRLENATPDQPTELECAIAHREAGSYQEAALVLQSWLVSNPQDASAYALLAQVLSLDKQDEPAWVALNIALSINPALPVVQRNHARLLLKQQKFAEALQAAKAAHQGDAADPENQLVLAAALGATGQNEPAFQLVEHALQSRPNYAEALANRALLKLRGNDVAGALADAEKSLFLKPHLGQLWGLVGSLRHQLKDLPGAIDALEKALDYEPDNVGHLVNLGEFKRQAGAVEAAIVLLEKAAALAPGNVGAWVNLGTALQNNKRIPEAKAAYAKALEIAPEQAEVASNLGSLAKKEENLEEALRYFNRALAIRPDFAEAHNNLGVTLQELGLLEEAVASLQAAVDIRPEFAEAHNNLGATLYDLSRLDEAEACYRKALQIMPDYADALFNLGHTLCDLDDLSQAAVVYQKAVDIDPANSGLDAAVFLAVLYYLDGDFEQCRSKLLASQPILAKSGSKYKKSRIYGRYLDKLLAWHQQYNQKNNQILGMGTLHVIGESHSLSAHGMMVHYKGQEMKCAAEWIQGCKQWHLGNGKANKYKHKFETVMARLPGQSVILLTIGEIDCRPDEGILKAWKKYPDKSLAEMMRSTVDGYISYVAAIGGRYGHRIIISGVPCTNKPLDALAATEAEQLAHLIRIFNTRLESQALAAGMDFLDVYALTDRGDGIASGEWHIDDVHLLPSAVAESFDRYCLQEVALPASSAVPQNSKKRSKAKPTKPDRSARKSAAHQDKNPTPQEINTMVSLFNEGKYAEAETLAQTMTERFPLHGFGWKVLGAVLKQMGQSADALAPMQKAAVLLPGDAEAQRNLGVSLKDLGRLVEAEASYRSALHIKPDYVDAHYNLGNALQDLGRLDEAEASYRRALQLKPVFADAYNSLGSTLNDLDRLDEAEASYRRALQLKPDYADAHYNLGVTLQEMSRLVEAEASYRRALEIRPDFAEAHSNLGHTLKELNRPVEAEASYRRALQIKPDFAEAHNNLGDILMAMGRLGEAEASCRCALQIKPDYAEAHSNLGNILRDMGRLGEAEDSCRHALQIKPDLPEALFNLGLTLFDLGKVIQASDAYQKALDVDPANIGLKAAVCLAILHYLEGNVEQCRSKLLVSQPIMTMTDLKYKNYRIYWRYLDRLLSWHQQDTQNDYQTQDIGTLCTKPLTR